MSESDRSRNGVEVVEEDLPCDEEAAVAGAEEPGPFTCFVRDWGPDREPDPGVFGAMWNALGRTVRRELRRRSLSQAPPQWLGIYGFRGWWDESGRGGPFEDLLVEAYRFVFVERFAVLKAQALVKMDIDGVVHRSIRNFLHDRQRRHDRLGARIFEVVSSAVRRALARGDLKVLSGPEKPSNSTVLLVGEQIRSEELASETELADITHRWNDELLPDLVTASRADKGRLVEDLARRLAGLELAGVKAFRLGALLGPLKADVRSRWDALLPVRVDEEPAEDEARGFRRLRQVFAPTIEEELIAKDRFSKLIDCADGAIEATEASQGRRDEMRRVLLFLRAFASDGDDIRSGPRRDGSEEDRLPSFRRLADHLKIPRERLRGLVGVLRNFLEICRDRLNSEVGGAFSGSQPATGVGS